MVIVPGQNKNLTRRYFANVIDYALFFILTAVYVFTTGSEDINGVYHVTGFRALAIPLMWFIYFPVAESVWMQTLGKRALHLYVVDSRGLSASLGQTLVRRILDLVELLFLGVPSLLAINYSSKSKRVGDMLAGTLVITSDAVCRFCGTELELNPKEVVNNVFRCPSCNEFN